MDSLLDSYNLFQKLRVLDSEGNELAWNKRSIKYNKRGDDYGFVRIPLTKDLEVGKDYHLILDVDIADTAGIHLPAARDIVFQGVDAGADKPGMEVVEDFEEFIWASGSNFYYGDNAGLYPSIEYSQSSNALFGQKSMQLDYDFDQCIAMDFCQSSDMGWDMVFAAGDTVGLHVFGDMSYNCLDLLLVNSERDTVKVPLPRLDYHGWRYVSTTIDRQIEGKYAFLGFRLDRGHELMGKTGTIRFDNLLKKEAAGIDELKLANMQLRVADDYIVVSADTWVQGIELIDVNGRTVKASGNNCLNISQVEPGIYLVRVHINGRTATQKVKL